jgi:hypothetical protein
MAYGVFGVGRHLRKGVLISLREEYRISSKSSVTLWCYDSTIDRSGDEMSLCSISIADVAGDGRGFVFVVCQETIGAECSFVFEYPFDQWSGKLSESMEDERCVFDEEHSRYCPTLDSGLDFVLDDF